MRDAATGQPHDRNDLDDHVWSLLDPADLDGHGAERRPLLTGQEAAAVATLLDELAALYASEPLGRTARELAVRLWDRLGV